MKTNKSRVPGRQFVLPSMTMIWLAVLLLGVCLQLTAFADEWIPTVEYIDKSSETLMQYTGQPRNAMTLNYNNNGFKDLIMTRYDYGAMGWDGIGVWPDGVPQFVLVTSDVFPANNEPQAGASGIVTADFDNDGFMDFFAPDQGNGGRLYRNINGDHYEDWTTAAGLNNPNWSSAVTNAFACSWGDYDADGSLDLALVSSISNPSYGSNELTVLHNAGGSFYEAVLSPTDPVGISPLWADFDQDGDLDLMILHSGAEPVGDPPNSFPNLFYINQNDGTFVEEGSYRISDPSTLFGGRIASVADFDNDGDLDVVCAEEGSTFVLENNTQENPGLGHFFPRTLTVSNSNFSTPTDLAVLDFDLDGFQDILIGCGDPNFSQGTTQMFLLRNQQGSGSDRVLQDITLGVGLTGDDKFAGIAAADYNRDGFSDLYLTRPATAPFFYKAQASAGFIQNNWVGLHLSSPYGANNSGGIGATVTLTAGTMVQAQVVDGGSGFASQHEADLVFGLDTYTGPVSVEIIWPTGHTQIISSVPANQYTDIVDDSPVIDIETIVFSKIFHVNTGRVDWVFTWETFNSGSGGFDEVTLDLSGVPDHCWPDASILNTQTYNVDITLTPIEGDKYKHILTYANVECEAKCNIPYSIKSGVSDFTSESDDRHIKISSCILSQ